MFLTPTLSERLTQIIEPLRRAVAAYGGKHRAAVPVVVLVWGYLHRVAKRFASLTARLEDASPKAPRASAPGAPRTDRPAPEPRPRLPQGFGWLGQYGSEFRCYGSQLQHLLLDPGMKELLATSPQAARILRPLCRMLGIEPHPHLPPSLYKSPANTPRPKPVAPASKPPEPSPEERDPRFAAWPAPA